MRVDMMRPLSGERITRAVAEEAARAAELLLRLSPAHSGSLPLNVYRDRFVERYDARGEVPLLELVQPDVGLGPVDLRAGRERPPDRETQGRNRRLLELAASALGAGEIALELDPDLIAELDTGARTTALPPTLEVGGYVSARSREALDAGEFRVAVSPMTGSYTAGRILGRFAYIFVEEGVRAMAENRSGITGADMRKAYDLAAACRAAFDEIAADFDAVLAPSAPGERRRERCCSSPGRPGRPGISGRSVCRHRRRASRRSHWV